MRHVDAIQADPKVRPQKLTLNPPSQVICEILDDHAVAGLGSQQDFFRETALRARRSKPTYDVGLAAAAQRLRALQITLALEGHVCVQPVHGHWPARLVICTRAPKMDNVMSPDNAATSPPPDRRMMTSSPLFDFDMTSWCHQKAWKLVIDLAQHIDTLRSIERQYPEIKPNFLNLFHAICHATEVLAYFCEVKWSIDDCDLILEDGITGLQVLEVRYGLRKLTDQQQEAANEHIAFRNRLAELLTGTNSNAQRIHELFYLYPRLAKQDEYKSIAKKLMELTRCQIDWKTFCESVKI